MLYAILDLWKTMNWPARLGMLFVVIVSAILIWMLVPALLTVRWAWDWDPQAPIWFSECPRCD